MCLRLPELYSNDSKAKLYPKNPRSLLSTSQLNLLSGSSKSGSRKLESTEFLRAQDTTFTCVSRQCCYNAVGSRNAFMFAVRLIGVLALVALNGFFAATEFSLVAVRLSRIRQLVAKGN